MHRVALRLMNGQRSPMGQVSTIRVQVHDGVKNAMAI